MTVHVTQAAEGLPRRAFTMADVLRMVEVGLIGEDERGTQLCPVLMDDFSIILDPPVS